MNILLIQLDGSLPNLALMRVAAHHRARGDQVTFRRWVKVEQIAPEFGAQPAQIYASAIFERSRPLVEAVKRQWPDAMVGGTGAGTVITLEEIGISTRVTDYSLYPSYRHSMGFTQRGCRLKCSFCVVPTKEGAVREEATIADIWRGDPWPRNILLLDNDFFGQPCWRDRIRELQLGGFKVCFTQGINARMLDQETAKALASVDYRDDSFKVRRLYTAWDNRKDEARLLRGLNLLVQHGVKPDHIMVFMLVGYWPEETPADREHRRVTLREFGARPYPMPYVRTPELVGFQRFVIGAYDKRVSWSEWEAARYRPELLS